MEYLDTENLTPRSEKDFRGPHRIIARRGGSVTGRRMWTRTRSKQPRGYDPAALIGLELHAEALQYGELYPQQSSFEAVTEACLLGAPLMDEQDIRHEDPVFLKYAKARVAWADPNYGPIVSSGVPKHHGTPSECDCDRCLRDLIRMEKWNAKLRKKGKEDK